MSIFGELLDRPGSRPFPAEWERYLNDNVAHFRLLSELERAKVRADTQVLVAKKYWEGCGGLEVTDEMKVTVAGQAALLLLHLEHDYFRRVQSILIYPSTFVIPGGEWMDLIEEGTPATGQAAYRGPVIVAWDAVLAEGRDPSSGRNVVIHEFAHQLDSLDGSFNGTPELASNEQEKQWQRVMSEEFEKVRRKVRAGHGTLLGGYAVKNETEFFSVASERFYTRPADLRRLHPELYQILSGFYGVNPIEWFARAAISGESG